MTRNLCTLIVGATITMCLSDFACADPLPCEVLKFSQLPMINTPIPSDNGVTQFYNGHDELSTAYSNTNAAGQVIGYQGTFMADDFADRFDSPVVHVKWWGSYLNQPPTPAGGVPRFLIAFERDIPAPDTGGYSQPASPPILSQIVKLGPLSPGSGTFTERLIPGSTSVDGPIYEYNAELNLGKDFPQKPDTVYWLKIVALVDPLPNIPIDQQLRWGWHNRDYTSMDPYAATAPLVMPGEHDEAAGSAFSPVWHFQDDAVTGFVNVGIDPLNPMTQIMPFVQQDVIGPRNYLYPFDGPPGIELYSKDLAFELYTVPEPQCLTLLLIGLAAFGWRRLRPNWG